jgi:GIY-YIG catalytic domain protein
VEFRQKVKEALRYYVYALVDSRNSKIFYIGKGKENRVFQYAKGALEDAFSENAPNLKLDTIRSIISEGKKVAYYIIRHNLEEKQAYLVESTLIDMLTYSPFNHNNQLTNLIAGTINGMKVLRQ